MSKLVQVFYKDIPNYYTLINKQDNVSRETDINALIEKVNKANGGIDSERI